MANFSKLHPSMEIEIRESTTTPLLQDLHKGELDVVFVSSMYPEGAERANFSQYPEYRSHSCFRESYQIVVSRDHPFAGRSQLTYEDLADQPFIMTDRTMDVYHRAVQKAFDAHRVPLHIAMYCTTVRSVLHMVSQNMGIAMLSPLVIEESDDLCIIPLKDAGHSDGDPQPERDPAPREILLSLCQDSKSGVAFFRYPERPRGVCR